MPETVTRTVLFDKVNFTETDALDPKKRQRRTATKGEKIELEPSEASRLEALGAVGSEADAHRAAAAAKAPTVPTSVADLRLMTVEGLMDYMAAADEDETERVSGMMGDLLDEKVQDRKIARDALRKAEGDETPPKKEKAAKDSPPPIPGTVVDDETLAGMNASETVAYLSQHPDEIDRVETANDARGDKAFATVTKAVAKTR